LLIPTKPTKLKQGEKIGVIAPAGPVLQDELQDGIDLLESFGHKIVLSPHLFDRQGYLAGEDNARLEDIHAMFSDKSVKAVYCARGGYGTLRILDRIDYNILRGNPKILVGYSDITALLLAVHKETGLVTFHGPVMRELNKRNIGNLESFLNLVTHERSLELELAGGRSLKAGRATGTLLGGNLSLICHLIGSPYMPSLKGAILFMEEKGEDLYRVDRLLTHLRLSGVLAQVAGLIVGAFEDCGDRAEIERLLSDMVSGLNIPVLTGLPIGHGLINITLPIGLPATIDSTTMTLKILEPSVIP
jgi:muramoyltetrapeptide carboxypeptidase